MSNLVFRFVVGTDIAGDILSKLQALLAQAVMLTIRIHVNSLPSIAEAESLAKSKDDLGFHIPLADNPNHLRCVALSKGKSSFPYQLTNTL